MVSKLCWISECIICKNRVALNALLCTLVLDLSQLSYPNSYLHFHLLICACLVSKQTFVSPTKASRVIYVSCFSNHSNIYHHTKFLHVFQCFQHPSSLTTSKFLFCTNFPHSYYIPIIIGAKVRQWSKVPLLVTISFLDDKLLWSCLFCLFCFFSEG